MNSNYFTEDIVSSLFENSYENYINKVNINFASFRNLSLNHPMVKNFCNDYGITNSNVLKSLEVSPLEILYVLLIQPDSIKSHNDSEYNHCISIYLKMKTLSYTLIVGAEHHAIMNLLEKIKSKLIIILENLFSKMLFIIMYRIAKYLTSFVIKKQNQKLIEIIDRKYSVSRSNEMIIDFDFKEVENIKIGLYRLIAYCKKLKTNEEYKKMISEAENLKEPPYTYNAFKHMVNDYDYYVTKKQREFRLLGITDNMKNLQGAFGKFKTHFEIKNSKDDYFINVKEFCDHLHSSIVKKDILYDIRNNIGKYYKILSVLRKTSIRINPNFKFKYNYEKCKYVWTRNMCELVDIFLKVCYIYIRSIEDKLLETDEAHHYWLFSFLKVYSFLKYGGDPSLEEMRYTNIVVQNTLKSFVLLLETLENKKEYNTKDLTIELNEAIKDTSFDTSNIENLYSLVKDALEEMRENNPNDILLIIPFRPNMDELYEYAVSSIKNKRDAEDVDENELV